ncbi:unnamed protein product [Didymodactylos carnosus]|uniref:Uncharacterized protein n=1 Tax=Didymodactylos carnosus TaxID=1234261 RepID=A0A8S2HRN4_9BILA|nr:unnamed protein product [Didymodactylos carnosus]CAF3652743.1 unnamed protein product [Didymodactylos carnosus]
MYTCRYYREDQFLIVTDLYGWRWGDCYASAQFEGILLPALLEDFLKKQQQYSGGKENVVRWLEDLEQQFSTMKHGNVHSSTYYVTQSFQCLQQYSQAINQIANADMDERTKVQYLMANLLPSLKMKVISKDPQTTDQFLQIARKVEDLQALVNQDERMNNYSNDSIGTTSNVNFSSAPYVAPPLRNNNHQKQQYTQQQQPRSQLEAATTNIPITDSVLLSQQVVSPSTRQQSNTDESSTRKNSNNLSSNLQNYQYHQQPSSNRNRRWNNCDPRNIHPRDAQHFQ